MCTCIPLSCEGERRVPARGEGGEGSSPAWFLCVSPRPSVPVLSAPGGRSASWCPGAFLTLCVELSVGDGAGLQVGSHEGPGLFLGAGVPLAGCAGVRADTAACSVPLPSARDAVRLWFQPLWWERWPPLLGLIWTILMQNVSRTRLTTRPPPLGRAGSSSAHLKTRFVLQ